MSSSASTSPAPTCISQGRTLANSEPQLPLANGTAQKQSAARGSRPAAVSRATDARQSTAPTSHGPSDFQSQHQSQSPFVARCPPAHVSQQDIPQCAAPSVLYLAPPPLVPFLSPIPRPLSLSTLGFDLELRSTHTLPRSLLYPGGVPSRPPLTSPVRLQPASNQQRPTSSPLSTCACQLTAAPIVHPFLIPPFGLFSLLWLQRHAHSAMGGCYAIKRT